MISGFQHIRDRLPKSIFDPENERHVRYLNGLIEAIERGGGPDGALQVLFSRAKEAEKSIHSQNWEENTRALDAVEIASFAYFALEFFGLKAATGRSGEINRAIDVQVALLKTRRSLLQARYPKQSPAPSPIRNVRRLSPLARQSSRGFRRAASGRRASSGGTLTSDGDSDGSGSADPPLATRPPLAGILHEQKSQFRQIALNRLRGAVVAVQGGDLPLALRLADQAREDFLAPGGAL